MAAESISNGKVGIHIAQMAGTEIPTNILLEHPEQQGILCCMDTLQALLHPNGCCRSYKYNPENKSEKEKEKITGGRVLAYRLEENGLTKIR